MDKIKVLIVDDSTLIRRVLTDIINESPYTTVCGIAENGIEALQKIKELNPDVITLDVEMPKMGGLEVLKNMSNDNISVIMLSSLTQKDADFTFQALELGAFDFVSKPENIFEKISEIKQELIGKILSANQIKKQTKPIIEKPVNNIIKTRPARFRSSNLKTVVIAASTGGPKALKEVISNLPADLPIQYAVVQHMPANFTKSFAERLNKSSRLFVKEAEEGDKLEKGKILLAPGNFHMEIKENNTITLNQNPPMLGVRPCANVTIETAAKVFQKDLICVVLTGMGHDGAQGAKLVREYGGYCITENSETATIYGMPRSVKDAGYSDLEVPLYDVVNSIIRKVCN